MAKSRDMIERLMHAADHLEDLSRSDLQVLLRQAAIDIETLRTLVTIRDELWLEDAPPEGTA